jgi:hypothetical protein
MSTTGHCPTCGTPCDVEYDEDGIEARVSPLITPEAVTELQKRADAMADAAEEVMRTNTATSFSRPKVNDLREAVDDYRELTGGES